MDVGTQMLKAGGPYVTTLMGPFLPRFAGFGAALDAVVHTHTLHNRIARELRDAVSQTPFAANLRTGVLARSAHTDSAVREQAQVLERLNRSALAEMRLRLFELQPETPAVLRIKDDGCGFVARAQQHGHATAAHIFERASSLGANLVMHSVPGEGTEIILTLNRS